MTKKEYINQNSFFYFLTIILKNGLNLNTNVKNMKKT